MISGMTITLFLALIPQLIILIIFVKKIDKVKIPEVTKNETKKESLKKWQLAFEDVPNHKSGGKPKKMARVQKRITPKRAGNKR